MKISIDENLKGKDLFDFLIENKSLLIAEKKYNIKHSDAFRFSKNLINNNGEIVKANQPINDDADKIQVITVINTTNWFDSHKDVHIPGLWKKSLAENKELYLLQEHELTFKGIITDEVSAYTQKMSWKALGVNVEGTTEALIFDNKISKKRNPFMHGEYKSGHVKNHSVGMRYVVIEMAINDEDYKEEFAVWNKYINSIANKEDAEDSGYFWAVKEARVVEGSAVPIGSNRITPTLSVTENKTFYDTTLGTEKQPSSDTDDQPPRDGFIQWLSATKLLNN